MFERETRREKILEARNKELRLKEKTKGILNLGGGGGLMSGIGSGSGNAGGGEKGEEGKDGKEAGPNKFEKAALVAVSTPSIGVQDKKDEKRVKELVKTDGEKTGEDGEKGESKDEKKVGKKDEEEEAEDPIVKAEREFFEIIKQVKVRYKKSKFKMYNFIKCKQNIYG